MNIGIVGGSGYLGSELLFQAEEHGYEVIGTGRSSDNKDLVRFDLADKSTWGSLLDQDLDTVIWTAWSPEPYVKNDPFEIFLDKLPQTKIIYVSSDVTLCQRSLEARTDLGTYARRKLAEQKAVSLHSKYTIFVTGPIVGNTSAGAIEKRTKKILSNPDNRNIFWNNVYKTFVPVTGLARTILANMDLTGQFFAGPPKRQSYYEFNRMRLPQLGIPQEHIHPNKISKRELIKLGICVDTSYGDNSKRIWFDAK